MVEDGKRGEEEAEKETGMKDNGDGGRRGGRQCADALVKLHLHVRRDVRGRIFPGGGGQTSGQP
eukprot:758322-Hanusia_phi.AAC.2